MERRRLWLWLATGLYVAAVLLVWLGSADAPIDTRNSAFWYRTLRDIPGLVDVCGDFTWAARAIPAILAGLGALTAFVQKPRSVQSRTLAALGLVLAGALTYATTQNAIPLGEQHCIID